MQICTKCGEQRRVSEKGRPLCCAAARQRRYDAHHRAGKARLNAQHRTKYREKILAGKRQYYEKNWLRIVLYHARLRAKQKGVPFTITPQDITIPDCCPILGLRLKPARGNLGDASPTLDRIIPSRGYVPGNVMVLSCRANRIKSDGTADEHEQIAAWLRKLGS